MTLWADEHLYDEAVGPQPKRYSVLPGEWDDAMLDAVVLRVAAHQQVAVNVLRAQRKERPPGGYPRARRRRRPRRAPVGSGPLGIVPSTPSPMR